MAGEGGKTREAVGGDADPVMPALAGPGMSGVQGAVVVDLEPGRLEGGGEALAQQFGPWGVHGPLSYGPMPARMQRLALHPVSPQQRLLRQAAERMRDGAVVVYPTDSCYALGCHIGDKDALERIRRIRQADRHHNFTLVCRDLAEVAKYAKVDTAQFRMLKACTPGPYTFLLEATREVPRRVQHEKRRTIGIRVPDHPVPRLLLAELGEPIMTSTLMLPGDDLPLNDPDEIEARLGNEVDLLLDGGPCGIEPTTVVDLAAHPPVILRQGKGSIAPFGL